MAWLSKLYDWTLIAGVIFLVIAAFLVFTGSIGGILPTGITNILALFQYFCAGVFLLAAVLLLGVWFAFRKKIKRIDGSENEKKRLAQTFKIVFLKTVFWISCFVGIVSILLTVFLWNTVTEYENLMEYVINNLDRLEVKIGLILLAFIVANTVITAALYAQLEAYFSKFGALIATGIEMALGLAVLIIGFFTILVLLLAFFVFSLMAFGLAIFIKGRTEIKTGPLSLISGVCCLFMAYWVWSVGGAEIFLLTALIFLVYGLYFVHDFFLSKKK